MKMNATVLTRLQFVSLLAQDVSIDDIIQMTEIVALFVVACCLPFHGISIIQSIFLLTLIRNAWIEGKLT